VAVSGVLVVIGLWAANSNASTPNPEHLFAEVKGMLESDSARIQHCIADELRFEEVDRELLTDLRSAWIQGDESAFKNLFEDGSSMSMTKPSVLLREKDGIKEIIWNPNVTLATVAAHRDETGNGFVLTTSSVPRKTHIHT
jgi:hypothetical protein